MSERVSGLQCAGLFGSITLELIAATLDKMCIIAVHMCVCISDEYSTPYQSAHRRLSGILCRVSGGTVTRERERMHVWLLISLQGAVQGEEKQQKMRGWREGRLVGCSVN